MVALFCGGKVLTRPRSPLPDFADVVTFVVQHTKQEVLTSGNVEAVSKHFSEHHVGDVMNLSSRNPWYPLDQSASLQRLFETFCRSNIRRVPVLDPAGDLYTLASQTDAISFLASQMHSPLFQAAAHAPIEGRVGTWSGLVTVLSSEPAMKAFTLMAEKHVHGVAIVDAAGHLLSNISASDLRVVLSRGASFAALFAPVADFCRAGPGQLAHGDGTVPRTARRRHSSCVPPTAWSRLPSWNRRHRS